MKYSAGVVAEDPTTSVAEQTRQVLIWLADIQRFEEMSAVWDAWVVAGKTPARATVEARLAGDYQVEIMVEAAT
jgi:enamine deaminase RidA (YjgF/YER057c/UK114 family)